MSILPIICRNTLIFKCIIFLLNVKIEL